MTDKSSSGSYASNPFNKKFIFRVLKFYKKSLVKRNKVIFAALIINNYE